MEKLVTDKNWNYCHYASEDLKAMISYEAELNQNNEIIDRYLVTLINKNEQKDLFQQRFATVDAACQALNSRYCHLSFIDLTQNPKTKSGCESCQAH